MNVQNLKERADNTLEGIRLFLKSKYYKLKYGQSSMMPSFDNAEDRTDYLMKNLGFYQIDPTKIGDEHPEYWYDTDHYQLWMMTLEEIDIGYFAFRMHEEQPIAKIQQVHIAEREREKGLGRIIVGHMEKLAKKLDVERIYAFDRCEEFWAKMGYVKTEDISSELIEISYKKNDKEREDGFMVKNL
jgi:N-acetylglutamate synthase-like GNAT family acetyltransferase